MGSKAEIMRNVGKYTLYHHIPGKTSQMRNLRQVFRSPWQPEQTRTRRSYAGETSSVRGVWQVLCSHRSSQTSFAVSTEITLIRSVSFVNFMLP